ncbi:vWA domain-containing protein [Limnoglobus roseus]|uniref:VWA domain-containing protein n=1 Tax=Limnoglobus roseus TaxID=2598579 RepID=A0A5C1A5Z5_9BACT|nr:vWA domain-containing protein [Limnoglobus roseus]QEL13697.1 VWA domain-containing protein [Limnoglobus roseus]
MTIVKRLRLLTAILGTAAASAVIGTTVFGEIAGKGRGGTDAVPTAKPDGAPEKDSFSQSKFTNQPALTYKERGGKTVFAWQMKPTLAKSVDKDRDILVMVDTSASQAGSPLKRARQIIDAITKAAGANDRIDVWTVNLDDAKATRSLTEGFKAAKSDVVVGAAAQLSETEFAAGATDLKAGLEKAAKAFDSNPARQQVILFLGDGESAASTETISEAARVELGGKLDQANIAFYAVPLGLKINSQNLHGLATLTGGAVIRLTEDTSGERGQADFSAKVFASFAVPVLKPTKVEYGAEVAESYPTRLPPLRADRATLVVGSLKADAPSVTAKVEGVVDGQVVKVDLAERLPVSENDNYFLHAIVQQWRDAPSKDAPAILSADRALALGAQQFRLFREEFLSQAVFAINSDKIEHAEKLYQAAAKIDPANLEVEQGLKVIDKLRKGDLTRAKMKAQLSDNLKQSEKVAREKLAILAQAEPPPPAGAGGDVPPPAGGGLQQAEAERAILEQQYRVLVDETIRRSRQLFKTDPDAAYEDLKRQRDTILSNAQLSDSFRQRLSGDIESMMQTVSTQGAAIKRQIAEDRERVARTKLRINEFERQQAEERQTVARIDSFRQLMNQARFELAQQEAQVLVQERINRGQVVPPEATASYLIGQAATNLREYRELVRIREDRYLLTMMQVEKSFIPYPDEPPVHFPPAAVWRELTADREKYKSASIGADVPASMRRIKSVLEGPTAQKIKIENELDGLALKDVIAQLEKDHDLKFVILEDAFKTEQSEGAILDKKFPLKQKFYGLTVGAFLDIALQSIGAFYIVRPEYIEITTYERRFTEKVVQAFDIGELVYQIPSSVNQASLNQNQNVQTQNVQLFGQATFAGGFGAIGGIGLGGFGGAGLGGLGGLGGGGLGGLGGGGLGGGQGFAGGMAGGGGLLGGGAANNLGAGGGLAGVGGGQVGQFGNLGGQFGIQGNSLVNYQLISTLITEVVAKGEWSKLNSQFRVSTPRGGQQDDEEADIVEQKYLNSLAYYPPARALIVRANGKYHPGASVKYKKPEGANAAGGPGNPARDKNAVAVGGPGKDDRLKNMNADVREMLAGIDKNNPTRMWQQALDKSNVTDPGLVVACADFLMEVEKPDHVAEVIKTGIRSGLTTDQWAYDALGMALKESKASPADIQRVAMSTVDFEPAEAKGYLKAAQVANDNGQAAQAMAYCKKAAGLEPNLPAAYANALVYAGKASDVQSDTIHWATANLLGRDWNNDGQDYHTETKVRLATLVDKFQKAGQGEQVERFQKLLDQEKKRDLVIALRWQGEADLDLYVTEPSGSTASPTHKRTVGGGVMKCDILEERDNRSETYTAAMALNGTYKINVKRALGRTIGNTVQVFVTKHQGTEKESHDFFTVDLNDPKGVEISLADGTRTDLAVLPTDDAPEARQETTAAATTTHKGFGGGTSAGGVGANAAMLGQTKSNLPVVVQPLETRLAGVTSSAPSMRAVADVTADRKSVKVSVNPIFSGAAHDIQLPKVSLLPGAGQ